MSEQDITAVSAVETDITPAAETEAGPKLGANGKPLPDYVPYTALSKSVQARNDAMLRVTELEGQLAEFNKAKQAEVDEQARKNGEFEELANKYKGELEVAQAEIADFSDSRLEQRAMLTGKLSEDMQPFAANMSMSELTKFVDAKEKTRVKPREDALPGARRTDYKDVNLTELAKKNPAAYAEYRKSVGMKDLK